MKMYGKAENVAKQILESFENGSVPGAMAQVFINRKDNIPCRAWSFSNQLSTIMCGTNDARGFKQWQEAGRKVKKGTHSFPILAPCIKKAKDKVTGKESSFLFGFRSIPVFRLEDTEMFDADKWEIAGGVDKEAVKWVENLPLKAVADSWGLQVDSFNGKGASYLGYYKHGKAIAVGTENLLTWAHELVHAADDQKGTIVKAHGQNAGNETVAELGGAILLQILGHEHEADLGGCLDYVKSYSDGDKGKALSRCMKLIKRTCEAVALILDTAEALKVDTVAS